MTKSRRSPAALFAESGIEWLIKLCGISAILFVFGIFFFVFREGAPALGSLGLSEFFVGIIVVPIIGNVAEHFSAVQLAARNKPDVAQAIAAGSSTQVALLVAPLFVLASYPLGHPMDLVFVPLEIVVVGVSGFLFAFTSNDGESNWLEATQLLGLYAMAAIVFYFLPS